MFLNTEDSTAQESLTKLRLNYAAIAALITASTAAILFCPCDYIGQSPTAIILVSVSTAFGLAAAVLVFRAMKQNSGVTAFFKAATALAIVGLGVYVEFNTATRIIIWLAARSR